MNKKWETASKALYHCVAYFKSDDIWVFAPTAWFSFSPSPNTAHSPALLLPLISLQLFSPVIWTLAGILLNSFWFATEFSLTVIYYVVNFLSLDDFVLIRAWNISRWKVFRMKSINRYLMRSSIRSYSGQPWIGFQIAKMAKKAVDHSPVKFADQICNQRVTGTYAHICVDQKRENR